MVDQGKAIDPVKSVVLSPLNEGGDFYKNSYITFRIGKSDVNMWLINDSYLSFGLELSSASDVKLKYTTSKAITASSSSKVDIDLPNMFIRNACNVFDKIEVTYGGNKIYYQPYNIEHNTIKMLSYGESYLNSNYATYTTNQSIKNGTAYLKIEETFEASSNIAANGTFEHKYDNGTLIKNIMIPINQLIPIFSDVTADGFPIRNLDNQIEIRLYVASPSRYLCNYNHDINDFNIKGKLGDVTIDDITPLDSALKLSNVKMYNSHYVPDPNNAAIFDNKCSSGWKFKYNDWHIGLRQISKINPTNLLPFNIVSNNTKSLLTYCYKSLNSPSLMFRPEVKSTSIKFGSNQIPAQPIPGTTFETPFEYKFTVDDVLDNIDKYYAESNMDYNYSYRFIKNSSTDIQVPTSSFVLLGANYTNTDQLGGNSSIYNSQYQLSFDSNYNSTYSSPDNLTFVLGIQTEYGLIVNNGKIETINL